MTRYPLISLTVLLGLALSCAPDAPHDNPVDPASPEFSNTGGINGRVTLLSDPRVGIPGVEVSVGAEGPVFLTGADGSFIIANHAAGPVTLIAAKLGYLTDTAIVTIEPARALPVEIRLDALPVIAQGSIITEKIDEYFPGPTYRALISADVSDPDGLADLDSVWTVIENLWFPMAYSPTSRLYEATVFDYNLPTNNLQWLVGKELHVVARDFAGASADAGNIFVTRIIEDSAFPLSPASGDTAASSPLLVWNPAQATFFHTLTLAIVRQDAGTQTPIWSQEGIDASLQSFQYGDTLVSGSYFWTIAVVDGFGNLCRSKPSSFIVN